MMMTVITSYRVESWLNESQREREKERDRLSIHRCFYVSPDSVELFTVTDSRGRFLHRLPTVSSLRHR